MKRLLPALLCLVAFLTAGPPASAVVTWDFDYSTATHFDNSPAGLERRAALEDAAATVGGWLDHTATVTIKVTSTFDPDGTALATAGAVLAFKPGPGSSTGGYVRSRILTGVGNPDQNGTDGFVTVNFGATWALGDVVPADAYDFKSTMMHELMHSLGVMTVIAENGNDVTGIPPGNPGRWTVWDGFLTDAAGTPIINPTTFALNGDLWNTAKVGGGSDGNPSPNGLHFSGPHAMAANGGMPVRIYSPNPWKVGSSAGHLDDLFYHPQELLMESAAALGLGARTLTPVEFGILKDLGYNVIEQGSNADLATLSFSAGTLTPAFAAATTAYHFSVPIATAATTVTAALAGTNSTLQVQLNGGSFSALTSGTASGALALNAGSNTVVVRVTAEDGTTVKNYTTTITRAAAGISVPGTNPGPIPDGLDNSGNLPGPPLDVQFEVTQRTGTVTAVSVQFTLNPPHGYASDLYVQLIAPDNTTAATIFDMGADDHSDLGGPYTFEDSAAGPLTTAAGAAGDVLVAPGTYRAAAGNTLTVLNTVFAGTAPNGTWRLRFIDFTQGDTGTVSQASLSLTTSAAPPSQATAAITLLPDRSRLFSATGLTPDTSYRVQGSNNLSSWTVLQTVTSDGGGAASYTDPESITTRGQLYYYRLIPAP